MVDDNILCNLGSILYNTGYLISYDKVTFLCNGDPVGVVQLSRVVTLSSHLHNTGAPVVSCEGSHHMRGHTT